MDKENIELTIEEKTIIWFSLVERRNELIEMKVRFEMAEGETYKEALELAKKELECIAHLIEVFR